jgi:AcrR family transcriptional regulator
VRQPRATLTSELIIDRAVDLADREGLDAVTLRRLANELGVHVTSLYNHVPGLEAITDGIVTRLIAEADLPTERVSWEEWVRRFTRAMAGMAIRHPGAFAALQRRPVQGERAAESFELALEAFTRAGFTPEDAYGALKATTLLALSLALEQGGASRGELPQTEIDQLTRERFPTLHAVAALDDGMESAWDFSLEVLVSGLRSQLRRRRLRT